MHLSKPILPVIALLLLMMPAQAWDSSGPPGKVYADRNCTWCHGPSLQGFTTAPRLAGQRAEYIERQMLGFKDHSRDNPYSREYMWGASRPVSPEIARALGAYLSTLPARPANDGDQRLAAEGKALYRDGSPSSNVPSCVVCHGPGAEGTGAFPRLGGLSYSYLKRKLEQWGEGYHTAAIAPMPGVASKMSAAEIEAIASYLSFVQ